MGRLQPLASSPPDAVPHATAYVDDMVGLVADLVTTGYAYQGGDGVYFSTASLPGYGLLARQDVGTLRAGARKPNGMRASARHWTLRCGSWPRPESRRGRRRGGRGDRLVYRVRGDVARPVGRGSTSTWVASTSPSPIMKTGGPRR